MVFSLFPPHVSAAAAAAIWPANCARRYMIADKLFSYLKSYQYGLKTKPKIKVLTLGRCDGLNHPPLTDNFNGPYSVGWAHLLMCNQRTYGLAKTMGINNFFSSCLFFSFLPPFFFQRPRQSNCMANYLCKVNS